MTNTAEPEHLDLRSTDIPEEKQQQLLRLFSKVRPEDERINFDRIESRSSLIRIF